MEVLVSAKVALLLALRRGPGYGIDLVRQIQESSGGTVRLGRGNTYPALQAMEKAGLVRGWTISPRGARGARSRVYYELTPDGIAAAEVVRGAIVGLATIDPPSSSDNPDLMIGRLRDCAQVSAFTLALQDGMSGASSA